MENSLEESFKATLHMEVKKKDVKQIRLIINQLMAMNVIDAETGEAVILGTFCFK